MAHAAHHVMDEVPLRRRMFRFALVSILIVTAVVMVQTVVTYLAMPKSVKATHHARAACGLFVDWIDQDGAARAPAATATLRKATDKAHTAVAAAPDRWSPLLKEFRAVDAPSTGPLVAGPGIGTPRDHAISNALAICDPLVAKTSGP